MLCVIVPIAHCASENGFDPLRLAAAKSSPEMFGLILREASRLRRSLDMISVWPLIEKKMSFSFLVNIAAHLQVQRRTLFEYFDIVSCHSQDIFQQLHFVFDLNKCCMLSYQSFNSLPIGKTKLTGVCWVFSQRKDRLKESSWGTLNSLLSW
jgi:hypothetical protein